MFETFLSILKTCEVFTTTIDKPSENLFFYHLALLGDLKQSFKWWQ